MAYGVISSVSGQAAFPPGTTTTTGTIDTTGASCIVIYAGAFTGSTATPTDNKSNTYVALAAERTEAGAGPTVAERWFLCASPSVGSGHTFTLACSRACLSVIALSGSPGSPFDQEAGGSEVGATAVPAGTLTPADSGGIALTGCVHPYNNLSAAPTGFTLQENVNQGYGTTGISLAYKNASGGSALSPSWTVNSVDGEAIAGMVTLTTAGGGAAFLARPNPFRGQAVNRAGTY